MRTCGKIGRMNKKGIDTMLKNYHVVQGIIVTSCMAGLLACGDSSGDSKGAAPEVVDPVAESYATEDDLPGCIEKFKGDVALVEKDSVAFKCEDGRWVNKGKYIATEENIKNCTEKREGEVAYIVDEDKSLVCEDGKWVKASAKVPDKVGEPAEPAEGSSASNASSSSWNHEVVTGSSSSSEEIVSNSSSSRNDEQGEVSSESNSSSSRNDAQGESSSSVSSSSFVGCKTAEADNCEYGELVDDRDGQKYKTVKIGDQWWMAENLNYADSVKTPSLRGKSWCYDNELDSCAKYGLLYTWAAAMDSVKIYDDDNGVECGWRKACNLTGVIRGICPEGWHLPSGSEWSSLYSAMGESPHAMQAKGFAEWLQATDAFGFSAFPAGRNDGGRFNEIGFGAHFWTSTEDNGDRANHWGLYASGVRLFSNYDNKYSAFSVRCVKD